ncbi:MAG: S8 family serine peptidase, partial [Theionarchaea archaeon]|nr:S8 family serine peptidase [Theionarchaea archaeon]
TPYDDHGHGTHVASIAVGADAPYGVAPGASLMAAKVCDSGGSCPDTAIIMGIDFGVAQGADVENISLGGPGGDGTSALAQECNWAVDQGVVVVCAAGDGGPSCCTVGTPGDATKVITVGASDKSDALASFSSRGPTTDDRVKPDITSPGVSIYAAANCTSCSDVGMSGTSMATPHIAGVAALMLDARGSATPLQIKNCMGATAIDKGTTGKDCLWGWGRVDAYAAVNQIISNPNVSPPGDASDCGCECGGGMSLSLPSPLSLLSPLSPPTVTITNPTDGSNVSGTVNITTSTTGCIRRVKFYLIWISNNDEVVGEYLCEDSCPPFECSWNTSGYPEWKWYTIRADGRNPGGAVMDVDEITVRLLPSSTFHPARSISYGNREGLGTMLLAFLLPFGCAAILAGGRMQGSVYLHTRKINSLKDRRVATLILVLLLSLSIPAALSSADTFSVEYQFSPASLGDCCGPQMVEDTVLQEIPGEPLIPYRAARILLPQGTELKDVKVRHSKPQVQKGIDIPWGQPPCTFSDEPVKVGKNEEIYGSDNPYPSEVYKVLSVESFRGFQILNMILYPVQYQPKSGTVKFYQKLTVEVQFGKGMENKLYRGLAGDKADVSAMVDNPEIVGTYEDRPSPLSIEEYIVITNDTLLSTFLPLTNHKGKYVNGATVYTVSWIYSNYTGVDNPEKIRNFIKDMYTNHGTKWVLLGGDIAAVPYRGFYVYTGGYVDYDMLADMYFGHLDGTFNSDGDSRWAEPNDGVDWYAEVAVGRAPVESTTEAEHFVSKVIVYDQSDKPKRVLLHQSRVRSGNDPDSRCLPCNCGYWVPSDYYKDYLWEEDGTVTQAAWINAWAANPVAVEHIGHGSPTSYYINYEVGGTVTWSNSDVSSLTNTFFPWHTTVACHTGKIEYNDCLAEEYVKADHGAIACIHNDNYGWFSILDACKYSGEFCEMEFRACWNDGKQRLGDMLNQARSYLANSASSNSYYRWCFYERNLVGDPESQSGGGPLPSPPSPPKVTITNPTDGSHVSGTVSITTSTTKCIIKVKFYIIWISNNEVVGELLCEDEDPPFECSWNTAEYSSGWYTIRADGYNPSGKVMDVDEITVRLLPSSTLYPVRIANFASGEGLGTALLSLLVFFGSAGIMTREF